MKLMVKWNHKRYLLLSIMSRLNVILIGTTCIRKTILPVTHFYYG